MIYICWAISSPASRKHVRELDLKHAIQLISQSPGVQLHCGTIEIRPAADISGMMRERERETFSEFALLHCFSYKRSRLSKRCHIDDEAIVYVAFQQPFVNISPVKRASVDRTDQIKSRMGGFIQTAFWEVRSEPFGS